MAAGDLLIGYHDAVHEQTVRLVSGVTDPDLNRVVDEGWDPPVTLGVRLVSVIDDCAAARGPGRVHPRDPAALGPTSLRTRCTAASRAPGGSHRQPSCPASS